MEACYLFASFVVFNSRKCYSWDLGTAYRVDEVAELLERHPICRPTTAPALLPTVHRRFMEIWPKYGHHVPYFHHPFFWNMDCRNLTQIWQLVPLLSPLFWIAYLTNLTQIWWPSPLFSPIIILKYEYDRNMVTNFHFFTIHIWIEKSDPNIATNYWIWYYTHRFLAPC